MPLDEAEAVLVHLPLSGITVNGMTMATEVVVVTAAMVMEANIMVMVVAVGDEDVVAGEVMVTGIEESGDVPGTVNAAVVALKMNMAGAPVVAAVLTTASISVVPRGQEDLVVHLHLPHLLWVDRGPWVLDHLAARRLQFPPLHSLPLLPLLSRCVFLLHHHSIF